MNTKTIAICDDSAADRKRLREHVQKYSILNTDIKICEYKSGEELLTAMRKVKFFLIFLDIQMGGLDGNETARKIREWDDGVILVFYTGYAEPSPQSFEVQPYRYIMKNMSDEEINRYIKASLNKMNRNETMPVFEAKANGTKLLLKPDDIVYIEKYKKNTKVHISERAKYIYSIGINDEDKTEIRISDKLENIYSILKNHGFGCPHSSYIINFKYLIDCKIDEFRMKEFADKAFRITRSKASEFNKLKRDFVTMKYNSGE